MFTDGLWLGDPAPSDKVFISGITKNSIARVGNEGTTPDKLAVKLLTEIFDDEVLSKGNCTQPRKKGIELLDQEKVKAIRCEICSHTCLVILYLAS